MRKRDPRVRGLDARVIPLPDVAGEDVEIDIAREPDLPATPGML
jgi:hypothetical protein